MEKDLKSCCMYVLVYVFGIVSTLIFSSFFTLLVFCTLLWIKVHININIDIYIYILNDIPYCVWHSLASTRQLQTGMEDRAACSERWRWWGCTWPTCHDCWRMSSWDSGRCGLRRRSFLLRSANTFVTHKQLRAWPGSTIS